jgi:cell division protein FtsQ
MSSGSWTQPRRFPSLPRLFPRRLLSLHTLLLIVVVAAIAALGWFWYRGSSFVKIQRVTVTGLSGPDVSQIRSALTDSALSMTTLNVSATQLEAAVQQYAAVKSLTVSTAGSHAVTIAVDEQVPVAVISDNGQSVMVDGNGQLVPSSTVPHGALPTLPLSSAPAGAYIEGAGPLAALKVLQAAPYQLLSHVESASTGAAHGVTLTLRNGPELYFGPATQLAAKWVAVAAVLESPSSAGAAYIDVSDPQRPAAGVTVATTTTSGTTASGGTSGETSTTASPGT